MLAQKLIVIHFNLQRGHNYRYTSSPLKPGRYLENLVLILEKKVRYGLQRFLRAGECGASNDNAPGSGPTVRLANIELSPVFKDFLPVTQLIDLINRL